jgi:DNA-binding CsgD family transcriptional regulator
MAIWRRRLSKPDEVGFSTVKNAGSLVGRDGELRRVTALADVSADRPVVVFGPWGSGKSAMLRALAESARARGVEVVQAAAAGIPGGASSPALAPRTDLWALLGQLSPATRLPALADTVARSPLAAGMAAVRLLANAADASAAGVLALVDDAQRLDEASAQALAVVCRRLRSVRAGVVLASSERTLPSDFDVPAEEVALGPLGDHDAHLLLERRTGLSRGWLRRAVVAQAMGNPLALLDYARTVAGGLPEKPARWIADRPLPCSRETMERLAEPLGRLPSVVRLALLIAASTSSEELAEVIAADPLRLTPGAWRAAEQAGLVTTSPHGVEFSHPLIRSAVYHGAHQDERAVVHRGIAEALAGRPERRAWHLAEALPPGRRDRGLATQLEHGAGDAARRRGAAAAAAALERSAALTDDDEDIARRLTKAAEQAALTGDAAWTQALAARALTLTKDPGRRDSALMLTGSSLVWAGQYQQAVPVLLPLARTRPDRDPRIAVAALCAAATAAYSLGETRHRGQVADAAGRLADSAPESAAVVFSLIACAPFGDRDQRTARLREHLSAVSPSDPRTDSSADPQLAGTAAWLLDESELAVEALGRDLDRITQSTGRGPSGGVAVALAAACLDTGRWSRARNLAERVLATELLDRADISLVAAQTTLAFLAAHRGDAPAATRLAAAAEQSARAWSDRAALAKAMHAAGLAALNAAEDDAAYERLRELLSYRGEDLLHYHCSYYAVADFALAAVRTGRRANGTRILAAALRRLDGSPSPRIEMLVHHAKALLSTRQDQAEQHFRAALAPAGGQWPLEQARTALHYAEWLRRCRRASHAVPLLVSARRSFELVGAQPGVARVDEELRAAGGSGTVTPRTAPGRAEVARAWSQMSARQQNVLLLAAQGRSNGEIAAELFLSPRTVGSHLYRAFPSLGISSRRQIHAVLTDLEILPAAGPDRWSS